LKTQQFIGVPAFESFLNCFSIIAAIWILPLLQLGRKMLCLKATSLKSTHREFIMSSHIKYGILNFRPVVPRADRPQIQPIPPNQQLVNNAPAVDPGIQDDGEQVVQNDMDLLDPRDVLDVEEDPPQAGVDAIVAGEAEGGAEAAAAALNVAVVEQK
jgi:hypothetical protein